MVPGASAAAKIEVSMDSGSGTAPMSKELVKAPREQLRMKQSVLMQACVGHALEVTSL